MFQNFDNLSDPSTGTARVARLRETFTHANIDGFIIPHSDEHQSEYLPASAERLAWLSGFTGSAGCAIVLCETATVFVDGRYTLQVREQVDQAVFQIESLIDNPPAKWLGSVVNKGDRIGFDPWLHTIGDAKKLAKSIEDAGGELIAIDPNPIDAIWSERPEPPVTPVQIHPVKFAGKEACEKLADLSASVREKSADCCVLSDPSSIAWAFNIRGSDVPHTPLPLCFAILHAEGRPQLFIAPEKLDIETRAYLTQLADLHEFDHLEPAIIGHAKAGKTVMLDPDLSAYKFAILANANGAGIVEGKEPTRLPRAIKNEVEISGSRSAHLRDGAAVVEFLYWLNQQPSGSVDEISVARKLETCRTDYGKRHQMPLRDLSFDTISGSGPNGAIAHYRVNVDSNRIPGDGELFLLDSGGQYEDGTTDITRTIAIGEPTEAMRRNNTLVLKGHIAIAASRFPKGTRGLDIDVLARRALWQNGLDYAHGTGHGVGSFLAVHEGPQNISRRGLHELHAGMIISNEPGYYKEGEYGIRIENLMLVRGPEEIPGGDLAMLGFETLTLAPFDRRLIDPQLLDDHELHWLNAYHGYVNRQLSRLVDSDDIRQWLAEACDPIIRELPQASA